MMFTVYENDDKVLAGPTGRRHRLFAKKNRTTRILESIKGTKQGRLTHEQQYCPQAAEYFCVRRSKTNKEILTDRENEVLSY